MTNKDPRTLLMDTLKRDARRIENALDQKLTSFSKFSAHFTQETLLGESGSISQSGDSAQSMSIEIQDLIRELTEINERMAGCLNDADRTHSTALAYTQQHHRQRLRDYEQDYRRVRAAIEAAKAQAELLSTVRKDISQYKAGSGDVSREESALRERSALGSASDELSRVLGSAMANRDALAQQRNTVEASIGRMKAAAALLPGVNALLFRIRRRKARDMIIVSVMTVALVVALFFYSNSGT